MKNLFAALALIFVAAPSSAELWSLDYISKVKHLSVMLNDNAKDACWTNLTETREYAEEKVRMAGGTLHETGQKYFGEYYDLIVRVNSHRSRSGLCFGSLEVTLGTAAEINGERHNANHRSMSTYFGNVQNANQLIIELVQSFFESD